MIDRELLEAAAKAAGMDGFWDELSGAMRITADRGPWSWCLWRPLTDDGDALRLAVKLRITPVMLTHIVDAQCGNIMCHEPREPDPYAATRRAIVRAAAAMVTS